MKLLQRLTRAGLTFILLGSVAAVVSNNDAAIATTACTSDGTNKYRLTPSLSADQNTGTIHRDSTKGATSITLYTQISRDSGATFTQVGEPLLILSGTASAISFLQTGSKSTGATTATTGAIVYPNTDQNGLAAKSGTVRATFDDGSNGTYNVDFGVSVPN